MCGHMVWIALRYLEWGRIRVITYHTNQRHDLFRRIHNIRFWLPILLLAFRTGKKPLEPRQINVLRGPSLLDIGSSFKPSLSLVSYEREEEKETLTRRYRSMNRDLPSSWNIIHLLPMFRYRSTGRGLNTRDMMLILADSNPTQNLETVFDVMHATLVRIEINWSTLNVSQKFLISFKPQPPLKLLLTKLNLKTGNGVAPPGLH